VFSDFTTSPCGLCPGPRSAINRDYLARETAKRGPLPKRPVPGLNCEPCPAYTAEEKASWPTAVRCVANRCEAVGVDPR
jgi:hypothetical protein